MSSSPQKSNETSRPASPAADALEVLSANEDAISPEESSKMQAAQCRRKSSSWKGFSLKRQLSKAEMKIKSTFRDGNGKESSRKGSIFYHGPTEGTPLSPVEISPESIESDPSSPDQESYMSQQKAEKIADLIKNIEELGTEVDTSEEPNPESKSVLSSNQGSDTGKSDDSSEKKEKVRSISTPHAPMQTKRVEFHEDIFKKVSAPILEGGAVSRPSELSLEEEEEEVPIRPPRTKPNRGGRGDRQLSVPNIKLNKQDMTKLRDLRKPSTAGNVTGGKTERSKSTFIRRFSKYQLCESVDFFFLNFRYLNR